MSLAVKYISNFRQFTELLRVKHEDVFIRLFYDSLQGKCKSWVEYLSVGSIRSLTDFWIVFLKTWMEKIEFRAESLSIQNFREWNDMYTDEEIDENFSSLLSSYLMSSSCKLESKVILFEEFTELLKVKHEDVFTRLFYDSLQGKCKCWVEYLSVRSIRSIIDFWIEFLKTWMEKKKFRADSLSIKYFREWNYMCTDEEIYENFSSLLSSYLKSSSCNLESKVIFLE